MKKLPTQFTKKSLTYTQIKRHGNVAIYEVFRGMSSRGLEVVVIKSHNGYTLGKNNVEPAETYPGDSQWGRLGFTYTDVTCEDKELDANKKFKELVEQEGNRKNKKNGRLTIKTA